MTPATTTHSNAPAVSAQAAALRTDLHDFLARRLPSVMVPSRIVVLPDLPKLPNGKIDRKQLSRYDEPLREDREFVAPDGPDEIAATSMWAALLGLDQVGAEDDFFELGGDSLTATQMAARWQARTGQDVSLRAFLEQPTVRHLVRITSGGIAEVGAHNPRSIAASQLSVAGELPDDIRATAAPQASPYKHVFLTGGTGYTGAFLLRELLDRSEADVTVLVRSVDTAHAQTRVRATMEGYGIARARDTDRIHVLPGDLSRPYFDLDAAGYRWLSQNIDVIVHNGAWSNYALPFQRLVPVNVLGTQEVLRLAATGNTKPVHYISSLAVYPGTAGVPNWQEDETIPPQGVVGGYRQSKWVGDQYMRQAHRRGIPTCVYRPGQIAGSQTSGACESQTFLNAMIKGCIQLGAALEYDVALEITPVDYCAAAVAHIALSGRHHGHAFNLPGSYPLPWHTLVSHLRAYGYPLATLPYPEWHRQLTDSLSAGMPNELEGYLPLFGDGAPSADLGYSGSTPVFTVANTGQALAGTDISCHQPDLSLFSTYLDYFVSTGFLPAPNNKEV